MDWLKELFWWIFIRPAEETRESYENNPNMPPYDAKVDPDATLGTMWDQLSDNWNKITGSASDSAADIGSSISDSASSALEAVPGANEIFSYLEGFMTNQGKENDANRLYNATEAQKQRDWLENMRNSSYQATVQDLQKAGLNPAIALGSGFSPSPIGNSSAASYQQTGGDTVSSLLSGAGQLVSAISNFMPASKVVKVFSEFAKKK